jgi:hypothetical protein
MEFHVLDTMELGTELGTERVMGYLDVTEWDTGRVTERVTGWVTGWVTEWEDGK